MLNPRRPLGNRNMPALVGLDGEQAQRFLYNHLRNVNLQQQGEINHAAKDFRFSSNEQFWNSVLHPETGGRGRIGLRWIELIGFQLVDWFPRTPGLYHTDSAAENRYEAEHYVSERNGILFYEPEGKFHMMKGGVGSIRFKPISLKNGEYWLCTATSDNHCHSGIPLAIPAELMDNFEFAFYHSSRISGQVKFLPDLLEPYFYHMRQIPQIYVEVNDVKQLAKDKIPAVKVTPMVFFSGGREMELSTRDNVTYVTYRADSAAEFSQAVEWLEWYVDRYDGEIITNFDQQQPTFANAPFSLQNVMGGKLNLQAMARYHIENANLIIREVGNIQVEKANMTKINVKLGDGTTIKGDFVVANTIKNSFNKALDAKISDDLKSLLQELAKAVAKVSEELPDETAKQVARDLETLTAEATSETPRKQWWQLSIDGLTQAAKDIGEIGKPVLELAAQIAAILAVMPK